MSRSIFSNSASSGASLSSSEVSSIVLSTIGTNPTSVLDAIKTVDGAGSGLDADLLDGLDSTTLTGSTGGQTVNTPQITAPINSATNLTVTYTAVAAAYSVSGSQTGVAGSHLNSDWQLASDNAFTNLVSQSMGDTTNKISWPIPGMVINNTYYLRVRYRSTFGVSAWSPVIMFTVGTVSSSVGISTLNNLTLYGIGTELSSFSQGGYGASVTLSQNGLVMMVSAIFDGDPAISGGGKVYRYTRTDMTSPWNLQLTITKYIYGAGFGPFVPGAEVDAWFGYSIDMDASGNSYVISSIHQSVNSTPSIGSVHSYPAGSSEDIIRPPTSFGIVDGFFGFEVAVNSSFTLLAISQPGLDGVTATNNVIGSGVVHIYKMVGTTWVFNNTIHSPLSNVLYRFGTGLSFDSTGGKLVITSSNQTTATTGIAGYIYTYSSSALNGVYTLIDTLAAPSIYVPNNGFGIHALLSDDGNRLIVGNNGHGAGLTPQLGRIVLYDSTSSTWTWNSDYVEPTSGITDSFARSFGGDGLFKEIVVGAWATDVNGVVNQGYIYEYK